MYNDCTYSIFFYGVVYSIMKRILDRAGMGRVLLGMDEGVVKGLKKGID